MNTLLLLILLSSCSLRQQKVIICKSGSSYAYHNKVCQGLRNCTHRFDTVTVKQAYESGHKKACGYCYR